ncbi:protein ABHD1 [Aedes albopictus]|uniref:Putative alpha/beta hydrolase 1 n=1 Tax=Aedes albopictus TaxID=7160 RepID=A0A023ES32_AEDAL|nr:protein ABHD1-like [Aedes albopictus]XP_029735722.1 protein ABHD1-like [Aedes albopictus]XP_029735723.1 protein ABHD1-like [Aedes albopictus]XP_029735724.1 protein ABHD1-like [Aedes albopictus]XP_029736056.1 protein ABHD1-like [Aedes albopictus]XP_029736057.1 protein ABHD1-like [Aedes albopictus]XP_029736058.1 protein ABHD1-like [Aedes albopictus]
MITELYAYLTNLPRWHIFAIFLVGYLIYYLIEVVKRPILAVSNGPFKKYLRKNIPILEMKFWPTFWCVESRAQTVFASIIRSNMMPNIDYRREVLTLKDGGEVALDWLETDCDSESPLIIILPGLTGESQAEYIKCLVMAANRTGIRTVVFNNRGLGGVELKTPRLYCASNSEDLSEVISHVKKLNPHIKIGATGISMGGLILGNYLANYGDEAKSILTAAKIISVPWDVNKGSDSIEQPYLNSMLGRHLAGSLCRTVRKYDILRNEEFDWDMDVVLQSKTIKEFDSHFTSKHFGYKDVHSYYAQATLHNKLHKIKVPLLCLSAADDPFQPLDAIPIKAAEKSSHVAILITARGGHIGFLEGWWPANKDQYMGRLFSQFFSAALFDPNNEFYRTSQLMMELNLQTSTSVPTTPISRSSSPIRKKSIPF